MRFQGILEISTFSRTFLVFLRFFLEKHGVLFLEFSGFILEVLVVYSWANWPLQWIVRLEGRTDAGLFRLKGPVTVIQ